MRRFDSRLLWGLLLFMVSAAAMAAGLEVRDARMRLLPGDLPAAGYFSLVNVSSETMVLVGAESPAFKRVTMHQSMQENGMAGMKHVPQLTLAPGGRVDFAPGGYHLMLMKRQRPLAVGEEVTVTFLFEDGRRLPVAFQAVSPASL